MPRRTYVVQRTFSFEIKADSEEEAIALSEVYAPDTESIYVESPADPDPDESLADLQFGS